MPFCTFEEEKHQLDWSSIKILAKENNYWKHKSKEAYFITKHKDKAPLLKKKTNARQFQVFEIRFYTFMKISNSGKRGFLKFGRI